MPVRKTCLTALLCLTPTLTPAASSAQSPQPPAQPEAQSVAESQADLLARLTAAHNATNLADPTLKPWHMLANFDLLDPQGTVTDHGTFEEWWLAPDRWKRVYTSTSYSATVIWDGDKRLRTPHFPPKPGVLDLLEAQLLDPISTYDDPTRYQPIEQSRSLGDVSLTCIMLQPTRPATEPSAPLFLYPTLCFDARSSLRLASNGGEAVVARNRTGTFQGKSVALDLTALRGATPAATVKITQLATLTPSGSELSPAPELETFSGPPGAFVKAASGVIAGLKTGGDIPAYPPFAKQNRISGSVVLKGLIGQDGRVVTLQPVSWDAPSLADAATRAVRTWTYKPYLLNGAPVSVETTFTVNFRFAR